MAQSIGASESQGLECEQKESRMAGARDSGGKWGDRQGYDSSQKPLQVMVRIQFFH